MKEGAEGGEPDLQGGQRSSVIGSKSSTWFPLLRVCRAAPLPLTWSKQVMLPEKAGGWSHTEVDVSELNSTES